MNLLVVAGAGTSVELGVPAMLGMGEEFLAHVEQWSVEPELTKKMIGDTLDIEHLIEALDKICSARESIEALGEYGLPLERADKIRAEVEWFVQHAAERVVASDARLVWGPLLRASSKIDLTIATTNYDRAIELAANAESIPIRDGYADFGNNETATWSGFSATSDGAKLVKLHGSTDWYSAAPNGAATKLRHPMPLFGRANLTLANGLELYSGLVLPSREKLLTHDPYPRLSQLFLNSSDACDLAIFIGSSLRDPHIRTAAEAIAKRVPVFLVNPSDEACDLPRVQSINQYASAFLISALPNALVSPDPVAALSSMASDGPKSAGILGAVRTIVDSGAASVARCSAIDTIDELGLTLDANLLERLIGDPDSTVARYALGLISIAPNPAPLVEIAKTSAHAGDAAFADDLRLLQSLIV